MAIKIIAPENVSDFELSMLREEIKVWDDTPLTRFLRTVTDQLSDGEPVVLLIGD
jgi:hypothetical protein